MKKNRKLRRADSPFNFILTFGTLLLGILFVWIMKLEMENLIENGLKTYLQQQQQTAYNIVLQTETEPADTYPDRLIENIEEGFETSASQFVYIEKDGQLLFVKNMAEMNTVEVQQLDLKTYMKRLEKDRGTYRTSVFQTENGYTVGVCVREDYVKTITGYDMMYMHILMYGIIAAVCFVMIVYYLQFIQLRGRRKIAKLTGELQQKQLLLEEEVEKNKLAEKQAEEVKKMQMQQTEKEVLDLESIPKNQYKFNFYLNASHAIYIDGTRGEVHPHTWEIVLHVAKMSSGLVLFNQVEKKVEEFLRQYQSQVMNDFEPFTTVNPTLENLTEFLLDSLQKELNPLGWMIFMIEVSETPARTFVMSLLD